MIVAELAVLIVIAVAHLVSLRALAARVHRQDEADEGRRQVVYKMEKAAIRTVASSDRAVRKMVDQARSLHEDTRQLHQIVDRHVSELKDGHRG